MADKNILTSLFFLSNSENLYIFTLKRITTNDFNTVVCNRITAYSSGNDKHHKSLFYEGSFENKRVGKFDTNKYYV